MRELRQALRLPRYYMKIENALGNFRSTTDDNLHSDTSMAKHGDQRINTKSVDLACRRICFRLAESIRIEGAPVVGGYSWHSWFF